MIHLNFNIFNKAEKEQEQLATSNRFLRASPGIADFHSITRLSAVFCLLAVVLRCPSFNGRLKFVKTLPQFGKLRGDIKPK